MFFIIKNLIIILLAIQFQGSFSSERPVPLSQEREVPDSIKWRYEEERNKFGSYDLDHPEKFLAMLRKNLRKDESLIQYLEKLRIFANQLLTQSQLMQKMADYNYLASHFNELYARIDKTLEKLKVTPLAQTKRFEITPENDLQLEELLAHSSLLQESIPYTPQEVEIIYSWIIDPAKGNFLNILGQNRKLTHEALLTKKLLSNVQKDYDELAILFYKTIFKHIESHPNIIQANEQYFIQSMKNYYDYQVKLKHHGESQDPHAMPWQAVNEYEKNNKELADLYSLTYRWYQKLYEIIYNELIDTVKSLNVKYPEDKLSHLQKLRPFPEKAIQENKLPAIFPKSIPSFIKPSTVIALPNLDKELEEARKAWKSSRKENNGEKTPPRKGSLQESLTPRKIKESPLDESYMIAGEETPTHIIIHNPKNNTTELIYKTDKPNQIKNLSAPKYTPWVKIWFENPKEALEKQGYTQPGNPKYETPENRWLPIIRHAFSPLLDDFILKWGTQSEIDSRRTPGKKDILITIPGKIIHNDPTKKFSQTGVFTYIIDSKNGQWYHRMFTPENSRQLIEDLVGKGYFSPQMTGYYDVFFPPLGS